MTSTFKIKRWKRVDGGYESVPLAYRVQKVKGGYMPCAHCAWIAERGENPWRALYMHPLKTVAEAREACSL